MKAPVIIIGLKRHPSSSISHANFMSQPAATKQIIAQGKTIPIRNIQNSALIFELLSRSISL